MTRAAAAQRAAEAASAAKAARNKQWRAAAAEYRRQQWWHQWVAAGRPNSWDAVEAPAVAKRKAAKRKQQRDSSGSLNIQYMSSTNKHNINQARV